MTAECQFDFDAYKSLISEKTQIVALAQVTNVTGTRQPIEAAIELAHQYDAIAVIDGAQGIVHEKVDVQKLNADFYVFSGHKLFAPAGIGVLYGKQSLLESMPPWHGGGKMVESVSFEQTTFTQLPGKFEAGTPNVAGAIALAEAVTWYQSYELKEVEAHIHQLQASCYDALKSIEDIDILGYQPNSSVVTFVIDGVHHQDIATLLDQQGIAVRAGNHCAHPLMDALGVKGTVRISFAIYNTLQDVERVVQAIEKAVDML